MIRAIVYYAFMRHMGSQHNADYEVCRDLVCRFAYWLDVRFDPLYNDDENAWW